MSTRQYIGARYVPKFYQNSVDGSAAWEENVVYEPLTWVTLTNGHIYLSRKQVPATIGSPASNVEYWLDVGSYNGFIEGLQEQIDDIVASITTINSNITTINNKIKKNIIVIGNSYVGNTGRECTARLEEIFDHAYRFYSGGVGFVEYTDHSTDFEDLLDNAITSTSFDNQDITDILFVSAMGDTNAFQEQGGNYGTALTTKLASIQTKIATNFPNIKRVMVTLAESRNVANVLNHNKYTNPFRLHKLFKTVFAPYNIEYLGWTGFNALFVSGYFESDNYHPSPLGAKAIGEWIKEAYFGSLEYVTKESQKLVSFTNYQTGATVTIIGYLKPEEAQLCCRVCNLTPGNPIVMAANAVLCSTATLNIPLPAPATSTLISSEVINYNTGLAFDTIIGNIVGDSDGVATIQAGMPTRATNSPTGSALMQDFLVINYQY